MNLKQEAKIILLGVVSMFYVGGTNPLQVNGLVIPKAVVLTAETLKPQKIEVLPDIPMDAMLWKYLRTGLHYLETSGRNYPPNFVHRGGVAYGALGLSRAAVRDVIKHHAALSKFTPEEIFSHAELYEKFAQYYADFLLRDYLKVDYATMSASQVFDILQKAWFLGPGQYKKGHKVISSREKKAQEYIFKSSRG